jgi:fructokinase
MKQQSTRKVFCIGETVLDISFKQDKPVTAKPGGSLMNAAVSLARAGINTHFISELFNDDPGMLIQRFLSENGVSTNFCTHYDQGNTPMALAFLNEDADANYTFYKSFPKERMNQELPVPDKNDIVLFGSFYAITGEIREKLKHFLTHARNNETLIIYDPNFRKSHLKELPEILPLIRENISLSDIVRGSHEDFLHIFATDNADQAFFEVQQSGCNNLIYTSNKEDVRVYHNNLKFTFPVPVIEPVSTIGAGDSFNAGLIVGLLHENFRKKDISQLDESQWKTLINTGIRFSQAVCLSMDNYIPANLFYL